METDEIEIKQCRKSSSVSSTDDLADPFSRSKKFSQKPGANSLFVPDSMNSVLITGNLTSQREMRVSCIEKIRDSSLSQGSGLSNVQRVYTSTKKTLNEINKSKTFTSGAESPQKSTASLKLDTVTTEFKCK